MRVDGGVSSSQLLVCSFAVGGLAAIAFLAFPQIDLIASSVFHSPGGAFLGQSASWMQALRSAFVGVFFLSIAIALAGLIITRGRSGVWLRLNGAQWLFLAVCLAVGPGIIANIMLKDHWGRARPKQVVEFGGTKAFTPPLVPSNQCSRNCSFVSGEAASIFMPLYAAGLLLPQWSGALFVCGTLLGLAAGLVRVSQGAHFLSDVIFAGIFMALTATAVHRVMFRPGSLGTIPRYAAVARRQAES
jgi:lipid A 4'-phosphatase